MDILRAIAAAPLLLILLLFIFDASKELDSAKGGDKDGKDTDSSPNTSV